MVLLRSHLNPMVYPVYHGNQSQIINNFHTHTNYIAQIKNLIMFKNFCYGYYITDKHT
jgi:hypothetical protein